MLTGCDGNCFIFFIRCNGTPNNEIAIKMKKNGFFKGKPIYFGVYEGQVYAVSNLGNDYWGFYRTNNPSQIIFSGQTPGQNTPCSASPYVPINTSSLGICTGTYQNSEILSTPNRGCTTVDSFLGSSRSCKKITVQKQNTSIFYEYNNGAGVQSYQINANVGDEIIGCYVGNPILLNETQTFPYGLIEVLSPDIYKCNNFCGSEKKCCLYYYADNKPSESMSEGRLNPVGVYNGNPYYSINLWGSFVENTTTGVQTYIIYNNYRWELYQIDSQKFNSVNISPLYIPSYQLVGYTSNDSGCPIDGNWTISAVTVNNNILGLTTFETTKIPCGEEVISECPTNNGTSLYSEIEPMSVSCENIEFGTLLIRVSGGTPSYMLTSSDGTPIYYNGYRNGIYNFRLEGDPKTYEITVYDSYPDFIKTIECIINDENVVLPSPSQTPTPTPTPTPTLTPLPTPLPPLVNCSDVDIICVSSGTSIYYFGDNP